LDQRSTNSTTTLVWPYNNNWDHNAGYSSRSATIIKVEPLPPGTTDINVFEAGWDLLDEGKVVVYGALEPMHSSLTINRSASTVKRPKPFVLSGVLGAANVGDRCIVEVRKPGSSRWSYSSARGVTSVNGSGGGKWWYRYTPKLRGTHTFRVRFLGDITREPCLSRAIGVAVR
jgi:hypothetical protein